MEQGALKVPYSFSQTLSELFFFFGLEYASNLRLQEQKAYVNKMQGSLIFLLFSF